MQHERPRELKTGGWHWFGTHTADCRSRGCEPHATKDEARECQYEYELTKAHEEQFSSAHKCAECGLWTDKGLQMGGYNDLADACLSALGKSGHRDWSAV